MDWKAFCAYFEKDYDFLNKVKVSNFKETLPPILKISTGLTLKIINNASKNRLLILFPKRLDCAKWISVLCALEIKRKYSRQIPHKNLEFVKGQKLLFKGCVVEYDGYRDGYEDWFFIKDRNSCSSGVPFKKKHFFRPVKSSRALSPTKKVDEVLDILRNSEPSLFNNRDGISGLSTLSSEFYFEKNLIFVSSKRELEKFMTENCLNEDRINNLFLYEKIDSEGQLSTSLINSIEETEEEKENWPLFPCVVSSDITGAANYAICNPDKAKAIIVDGIAHHQRDFKILDNILNRNISVVVISDFSNLDYLQSLVNRDFKIWLWDKKNVLESNKLSEITKDSLFYFMHNSFSNYYNRKISYELCESSGLDNIVKKILEIQKEDPIFFEQIKTIFLKCLHWTLYLSRLAWFPNEETEEKLFDEITQTEKMLYSKDSEIAPNVTTFFMDLCGRLRNIAKEIISKKNQKIEKIHYLIREKVDINEVLVVLPKVEDVKESKNYWNNYLTYEEANKIFVDINSFNNLDRFPAYVIICGWLGAKQMINLLYSNLPSNIIILLYPFELKWFKSAKNRWQKQMRFKNKNTDFSDILNLPKSELAFISHSLEDLFENYEKIDFDIFEFEERVNEYRYDQYMLPENNRNREENVKAKLILFSDNRFAYIAQHQYLRVVTDFIDTKNGDAKVYQEIPRKKIDELEVGDYLLFFDSDKDLIKKKAEEGLKNADRLECLNLANSWKETLKKCYENFGGNFIMFVNHLRKYGLNRNPATIKNWIFGNDIIGPKSEKDIQIIGGATKDKFLIENLSKVKEAILNVRSAHMQASRYMLNKLLSKLSHSQVIKEKDGLFRGNTQESIILNLEDFGRVFLVKIEEIVNSWFDVNITNTNRLKKRPF